MDIGSQINGGKTMWPFRQQKPSHELGNDVPSILNELKTRKHWKNLPPALIQRFGANATYVFDRSGEAADAVKRLVLLLELKCFRGRLQQIANAEDWRNDLLRLSGHLFGIAAQNKQLLVSARTNSDFQAALFTADSAAMSSLLCEPYAMNSYCLLAQLSFGLNENTEEAALWCNRYRRAECDLLSKDESNLDANEKGLRKMLDPDKLRHTAEEMRRVLPKHVLESLSGFDSENPITPNEVVEQIEDSIGIQLVI